MSATSVLSATEFQSRLERYLYERSEEWRAVRVGEKEVSEQAEIVRRYADLFSREQLDALWEGEDELENRLLAERVTFHGEEMPLRNAQAKLAVLPAYADREELGAIQAEASAKFNDDRLDLLRSTEELAADYSRIADPVERNEEEKAISLRELSRALKGASDEATQSYGAMRERWFAKLLGDDRDEIPSSYHTAYMRRLSPLEATYTKE